MNSMTVCKAINVALNYNCNNQARGFPPLFDEDEIRELLEAQDELVATLPSIDDEL